MHFTIGRSIEFDWRYGYVFARVPFFGEVLWNDEGVQRWPSREVSARLRSERAAQQAALQSLSV